MNPAKWIRQILSGEGVAYNKASMFVEGDYIVPTCLGLPVTLSLLGTSATHLNMSGNVRSLEPLSLDVEGKMKPRLVHCDSLKQFFMSYCKKKESTRSTVYFQWKFLFVRTILISYKKKMKEQLMF